VTRRSGRFGADFEAAFTKAPENLIVTRSPRGPFAPPRDWDALKRAYETPGADPVAVAAANNITAKTLQDYARARGWSLAAAAAPSQPDQPVRPALADIVLPRGALTRRLRKTVAAKLEKLEMDIHEGGPLSPTDHERQSRAIGALAKAVEIADDNSHADTPATAGRRAAAGRPATAPETAGDDADKLRRELAARIKRLRERLTR
jgi:hypothetical protein